MPPCQPLGGGGLWRVWRAVLGPVQSPAVPVQGAGLHPAPPSFTLGPDVKITAFLSGKCGRLSPWGDRQLAPLLCARPLPGPPDGQEVSLSLSLCCGHAPSPSAGGRVCEPPQPPALPFSQPRAHGDRPVCRACGLGVTPRVPPVTFYSCWGWGYGGQK